MKGDFSQWQQEQENVSGVLHQQGRVLLDSDWNAQTQVTTDWQDEAARQIIGAGVAAIPAHAPDGFKVTGANVTGSEVHLKLHPGRGWADGLAVALPGDAPPVMRTATYLQPPPASVSEIAAGVRDAVVLEVWREALNAFQVPDELIEPALGGPDTTERLYTAMRFRLFRLGAEDTCRSIIDRLRDDPNRLGKLHATLQPPETIAGDCPVEEGGGYSGFEHHLYRIEIAQVNGGATMFKWSQFNGGLVGRGECDLAGTDKKFTLTANDQAIKMSGLSAFYLEVVEYDADQGYWRVTYGAEVTLNDDDLDVTTEHYTPAAPPTGRVFFRLWNGIRPLSDFPKVGAGTDPTELRDGIRLEFDAPGGDNYRAGDYWTFKVRAGDIANPGGNPLPPRAAGDPELERGPGYQL